MPTQKPWLALIGVCLLSFTAFLDFTIVNTALPFIQSEFQANVIQLQWVMNIYAMLLSMTMVVFGRGADLYGRRKVFYLGVLSFAIGSIGAALSPSILILIIFRGFQALGASILFTVSSSMLPQLFSKEEQSKAISYYTALTGLGLAIGPFLSGLIIHWVNWRWIFWINIPIIAVGFYFCLLYLPVFPRSESKAGLNLLGAMLLILSLGFLVFGIIETGKDNSWLGEHSWIFIGISILMFIFFYFIELKSADPILDFNIMKYKLILLSMLNCIVAGMVCFVLLFGDPLYLNAIYQYSAFLIGIILIVPPTMQVIISFLFSRLTNHFSLQSILVFSVAIGFIACLTHMILGFQHAPLVILLLGLIFIGINWGLTNPSSILAASTSVKSEQMGVALGTIFTIWNMSGAIFLAIASVILHNYVNTATIPYNEAFKNGFYAVSLFASIVSFIVLMLAVILYYNKSNRLQSR